MGLKLSRYGVEKTSYRTYITRNDMTSVKEVEFRTEESKKNLEMAMKAANMASWVYDVNKSF